MTDHLQSSTIITDENGNLVQRMDYAPYGTMIQNNRSGNPSNLRHTYTGQEDDFNTGLMYYGARYYDPLVCMFISPDIPTNVSRQKSSSTDSGIINLATIAIFAEPDMFVQAQNNPQLLNRYAYACNNPMVYIDETGELAFITALIIGAIIGAVLTAGVTAAMTYQAYASGDISAGEFAGLILAGALAGALGGAVTGGITAAPVASIAGNVAIGFLAGALGGATTGFTQTMLSGGSLEQGWKAAVGEGIVGGLAGAAGGAAVGKYLKGLGGASNLTLRQTFTKGIIRGLGNQPVKGFLKGEMYLLGQLFENDLRPN